MDYSKLLNLLDNTLFSLSVAKKELRFFEQKISPHQDIFRFIEQEPSKKTGGK